MTAQFHCQYTDEGKAGIVFPWWTIGGSTPYSSASLPDYHVYNDSTKALHVTNITIDKNNTAYTCEIHKRQNDHSRVRCAHRSKTGTIIILCKGISHS